MVRHVLGALGRWTCPLCGESFTHWPAFAIPHKRYTRREIEERVRQYVEDEACSYRGASSYHGESILHEEGPGGPPIRMMPPMPGMPDEPAPSHLARSTVWRWVGELGEQTRELRAALALIGQRDPNDRLHRVVVVVPLAKFRSPERERKIATATLLVRAWARIRGPPAASGKITPSDATGGKRGW